MSEISAQPQDQSPVSAETIEQRRVRLMKTGGGREQNRISRANSRANWARRITAGAAAVGLALGILSAPNPHGQASESNPNSSGPDSTPGLVTPTQEAPKKTLSPKEAQLLSNKEILNYMNAYPDVRFTVSEGPIHFDLSKAVIETGDPNSHLDKVDTKFISEINGAKAVRGIYTTNLLFTKEDSEGTTAATWGLLVFKSEPNPQDPNPTEHIGAILLTPQNFPNGLTEHNFSGTNADNFKLEINNHPIKLSEVGNLRPASDA